MIIWSDDFDLSNLYHFFWMCLQACRKVEDAKLLISVHQEYLPVYQDMDEAGDARDQPGMNLIIFPCFLQKKIIKKRPGDPLDFYRDSTSHNLSNLHWIYIESTLNLHWIYIESTLNLHQSTSIYIESTLNLHQSTVSVTGADLHPEVLRWIRWPGAPVTLVTCGAWSNCLPCGARKVLPIPMAKERKAELRRSQNCG